MEGALVRQLRDRHRELEGEPAARHRFGSGAAAGGCFFPLGGSSTADGQREGEGDGSMHGAPTQGGAPAFMRARKLRAGVAFSGAG